MERLAKNVNRHHAFYQGREYKKNSILNRLRNHQGFIIPMSLFDHRDLHRDLFSVPKPSLEAAEGLLSHIGHYDSQSERTDYLDMAINYLRESNPATTAHLIQQRRYVLLTPFTQIERDMAEMERDGGAAA